MGKRGPKPRPRIEEDLDADECVPPGTIHCDLCLIGSHRTKVLRFSLVHTVHVGARSTTRGAGSIRLCEHCWSRGPKTRMIRKVRKATVHA